MKKITGWLNRKCIHFAVWAGFICYETLLLWLAIGVSAPVANYVVHFSLTIACFYWFGAAALPWALDRKPTAAWRVVVVIATYFPLYIAMHAAGDVFLELTRPATGRPFRLDHTYVFRNTYRGTLFLGFATGYYYLVRFIRQKRREERMQKTHYEQVIRQQQTEKMLLEAQNAYLKAQINPHFLFNTLDYLYHNLLVKDEQTAAAILSLSRMMRYAVDNVEHGGLVTIGEELQQVRHLLFLYACRKSQPIFIDIETQKAAEQIRFIPMALLTLTENMIKHGQLDAPGACLQLSVIADTLCIVAFNRTATAGRTTGPGTGLRNLRLRLERTFGTAVTFVITDHVQSGFTVEIKVSLAVLTAVASVEHASAGTGR